MAATEWLSTCAERIADDESRRNAWNKLRDKCDTSFIIELLYLFTLPDEASQEAVEKQIRRWTKLLNAKVINGRVKFPLGGDRSQPPSPDPGVDDKDIPF